MISPVKEWVDYKSTEYLKSLIEPNKVVDTFLFYSGKIEFNLAQASRIVRAHTNRYVVYEFWHCVQEDPERIVQIAEHLHSRRDPVSSVFLQDSWYKMKDHYVRAALFFLYNSYSETGLISSGNLSYRGFNPLLFNRVKNCSFENMRINFYKDEEMIKGIDYLKDGDYLLLPLGKFNYNLFEEGKSYGVETTPVNHQAIKLKFDELERKTIILYKYHREVTELYCKHNITMIDKYGNQTIDTKKCDEVLIANF
tara:strand:- start:46 stop:804 length:759 start_codon:yes stop_codon:yes gene_type:complete